MTLENRLPHPVERDAATRLHQILTKTGDNLSDVVVAIDSAAGKAEQITLPSALRELLVALLQHVGEGNAVRIEPIGQSLTAQQAADILNVPLRHVKGLMQRGDLSHERVGRHQCIRVQDIFEYKKARDAARSSALDTLAEYDGDLL